MYTNMLVKKIDLNIVLNLLMIICIAKVVNVLIVQINSKLIKTNHMAFFSSELMKMNSN